MSRPASSSVPVDHLARFNVVVPDARAHAEHYARLFDMPLWTVRTITAQSDDGQPFSYLSATSRGPWGSDVALIAPGAGASHYAAFLDDVGLGVHSLVVRVRDEEGFEPAHAWLTEHGVARVGVESDGSHCHVYDTRRDLGGYYVVIEVGAQEAGGVSETWDLSGCANRPADVPPLNVGGLHHFGVVVDQAIPAAEKYAELWGITDWLFADFRPVAGSLDNPHYKGAPEEHGFFSGFGFEYTNFGFELVEPTQGASDYAELLALRGSVIHHLNIVVLDDLESFSKTAGWLETIGVPVLQYSTMGAGSSVYYYLDTRPLLGWVVEAYGVLPDGGGALELTMSVDFKQDALASATSLDRARPVRVVVQTRAAPGRGDEFLADFLVHARDVELEEGCLQYEMSRSTRDPDRFTLIELWRDADAYDAHWALEAEYYRTRSAESAALTAALDHESPGHAGVEFYPLQPYEVPEGRWLPTRPLAGKRNG